MSPNPLRIDIGQYTSIRECQNGLTILNRHDFCIGHALLNYCDFSPGERALFGKLIQPTDVVIEAGAHIGSHTVALSRMCRAVHAFEPQRLAFQTLCGNLALGECQNVFAYNAAVGKEPGSILVPRENPATTANTGGVILSGVKEGDLVQLVSLDTTGLDCNFLKADVEEMELDVILGAREMIKRCRPMLYLESNNNHRPLIELVDSLGYAMYWHFPKIIQNDDDQMLGKIVSFNVLCFPGEREVVTSARRIRLDDACLDVGVSNAPPPSNIGE